MVMIVISAQDADKPCIQVRIHQLTRAENEIIMSGIVPIAELVLLMNQFNRVRIAQAVGVKERPVPLSVKIAPLFILPADVGGCGYRNNRAPVNDMGAFEIIKAFLLITHLLTELLWGGWPR